MPTLADLILCGADSDEEDEEGLQLARELEELQTERQHRYEELATQGQSRCHSEEVAAEASALPPRPPSAASIWNSCDATALPPKPPSAASTRGPKATTSVGQLASAAPEATAEAMQQSGLVSAGVGGSSGSGRSARGESATKPGGAGAQQVAAPRSLADAILNSGADGGVDRELEDMERELERKMTEWRQQRESGAKDAGDGPQKSSGAGGSQSAGLASGGAPPPGEPAARGPPPTRGNALGNLVRCLPNSAEASAPSSEAPLADELSEIRAAAARMDEAFPEVVADVSSVVSQPDEQQEATASGVEAPGRPPQARPQRSTRTAARWGAEDREAAPPDPATNEMMSKLDALDVKLRALQGRQALRLPAELARTSDQEELPGASAVNKAVMQLQAQNQHLRDRMGSSGGKGLLHLDRAVFGLEGVDVAGAGDRWEEQQPWAASVVAGAAEGGSSP